MKHASFTGASLALGLMLTLSACSGAGQPQVVAPPVTVHTPRALDFQDYLEVTGNSAASQTVDLTARVEGFLRDIYFKDGSVVKKGALLFLIEPDQYQAKLALNKAQLDNAQAEYERQQRLIAQQATSQANLDSWRAQRDQAQANVQLAQINLSYTKVNAPFTGRIGRHLIDIGNLVGTPQTSKLATLEQLDPIWAYFTVNERDAIRVRPAMAALHVKRPEGQPVEAGLQTDSDFPYHGKVDFVDTGMDTSTGSIQLRAAFDNPDSKLLPGLFLRLRLPLGPATRALAVPDSAVSHDQAGAYVLLLGPENVVKQQRVQTGGLQNGMRAITGGLNAKDQVIVDGLMNAAPGNKVTPAS